MDRVTISSIKCIQGNDSLDNIATYTASSGTEPLIIADEFVTSLVGDRVGQSSAKENITTGFDIFCDKCSQNEISRIHEKFNQRKYNVVIGIGGGKTLDTAKAIAYYRKIPVVMVPTIVSTGTPISFLAVICIPESQFSEYLFFPKDPDMVITDTGVIPTASVRLLVADVGDALSTRFEARVNQASGKTTMVGGASILATLAIARFCYTTLLGDGCKARVAIEQSISAKAVENIIGANTYLSGIGFESSSLAATRAIHNGMMQLKECHYCCHGEKVAPSVLVQPVLENTPQEEVETVLSFCHSVDLPINLRMLSVKGINKDKLRAVAKAATAEGKTIYNVPFVVTAQDVLCAILTVHHLRL